MDLVQPAEFSLHLAHFNIQSVGQGMRVFEASAKQGQGMDAITALISSRHKAAQSASAV